MRKRFMIPLLLLVLLPVPALAWNRAGHELIALMAWHQLDAATRERISNTLHHHPAYAIWVREAQRTAGTSVDLEAFVFARSAAWPDDIKDRRRENPFHVASSQIHGNWHYIDEPISFDGTPTETPPLPNVQTALQWCDRVLRDKRSTLEQRAVATAWLNHLMGDVHQPLHCASRFSAALLHGDAGGNRWRVRRPDGREQSLHEFWDDLLASDEATMDELRVLADRAPRPPRERRAARNENSVAEWIASSVSLARNVVYDGGHVEGAAWPDRKNPPAVTAALSVDYCERSRTVAARQAAFAARRLAYRLSEYYAGAASSYPQRRPLVHI